MKPEYPADWKFGGADGKHPGADPRYRPTVYMYYSEDLTLVFATSEYTNDEDAIKRGFPKVNETSRYHRPKWLTATRPDGTVETLETNFNPVTGRFEK